VAESAGGLAEALEDRDVPESRCCCRAGACTQFARGSLSRSDGSIRERRSSRREHLRPGDRVAGTRIDEFLEDGIDIVDPTAAETPETIGRVLPGLVAAEAHDSLRIASDV